MGSRGWIFKARTLYYFESIETSTAVTVVVAVTDSPYTMPYPSSKCESTIKCPSLCHRSSLLPAQAIPRPLFSISEPGLHCCVNLPKRPSQTVGYSLRAIPDLRRGDSWFV
jgi:hypothetical protein